MSDIKDIYNKDIYTPFLSYCEKSRYKTMQDLAKCPFHLLSQQPDISPLLSSRIRTVFNTYLKANPSEFSAAKARMGTKTAPAMSDVQLQIALEQYFQENAKRIVVAAEAVKAVNGRAKRADVVRILEQASWCQTVDKGTFYYTGLK
ncbi:hypothetical protein [Hydrogenoanaerobacterium sp.]|uniref:hypothetical protein n=1 Tax=Hydrogenoanaerobacterium sp. TaxID=2953763 RepID=UPI00289768B5|nr:hypothetical protein [Hydrogenoanaerobacterium sp.]